MIPIRIIIPFLAWSSIMATEELLPPNSIPVSRIETVELEPGRTFESLVFDTIPGVDYTVESSADLTNWEPWGSSHYGLGQQVVVPMLEKVTGTPPSNPAPPAISFPRAVSIRLFRAIGGGTIISFRSSEESVGLLHHYPSLELSPEWAQMPLYVSRATEGFLFVIAHSNSELSPPVSTVPLSVADSAMAAAFETHFGDFDLEVQQNVQRARSTPPPLQPSGHNRRFFRVSSNPYLDTDSDGTPDWLELVTTGPAGPGEPPSDPFNGDTNANGTPDGQERDSDSDGTQDANDVAPKDAMVNWQPDDPFLFAFFPISGDGNPLQVNDLGHVLFERSLWATGQSLNLNATDEGALTNCYPLGIGDGGRIVGIGTIDLPGDSGTSSEACMVIWPATGGNPIALRSGEFYLVPVSLPSEDPRMGGFPPPSDMTINKDGQFVAFAAIPELGPGPDGPASISTLRIQGGARLWQVNNSSGNITEIGIVPPLMAWRSDTGGYVGVNEAGKFKINNKVFEEAYTKAALLPNGKLAALGGEGGATARVESTNWSTSPTLGDAIDVSEKGRFALQRFWWIWHNSDLYLRKGYERAPGLTGWDDVQSCAFLDTTTHGWTLAVKRRPGSQAMLGLPLFLSSPLLGKGLDHHSALADDSPRNPIQHRIGNKDEFWVMIPAGGSTQIRIRSAATAQTPVHIGSAGGITSAPSPLSNNDALVTLSAPASAAGQELNVPLKIGPVSAVSNPLRAKVMKPRVLNVSVWPLKRPGRPTGDPADNPPPLPSKEEFEEALNNIFKPQINITFNVTIKNENILKDDPGGMFNVENPPNETQSNIAEGKSGGHIQIFIMGGYDSLYSGLPFSGWTNPTQAWVWLPIQGLVSGNGIEKEKWLHTLTHEIGHVLVGAGHPDNSTTPGRARLPFTNNTVRLMHSGQSLNEATTGRKLLVKAEWDAAEIRAQELIDDLE